MPIYATSDFVALPYGKVTRALERTDICKRDDNYGTDDQYYNVARYPLLRLFSHG